MVGKYVRFCSPTLLFFFGGFSSFWVSVCPVFDPKYLFLRGLCWFSSCERRRGSISAVRTCMRDAHALAVCVEQPDDERKSAECDIVCS